MINQKEEESVSDGLKKALEGKGLRKATSFFDFINVRLYDHDDKYEPKIMTYYMWSELNQELQKRKTNDCSQWYIIEPYVRAGIVYIKE